MAVADGVGGTGGGASAADRLMVALKKLAAQAASADWWSVLLELGFSPAGRWPNQVFSTSVDRR